jgi:hypothetical protein
MAGDLDITERAVLDDAAAARSAAAQPRGQDGERVIHRYGRLGIVAEAPGAAQPGAAQPGTAQPGAARAATVVDDSGLTNVERLGLRALRLRESGDYQQEKANRPRAGEQWDMGDCTTAAPAPPVIGVQARDARAAGPTSSYLEGTVAVGIVIVQGPTADLQFTDAELTKVVAEVQNGLGYYATTNPLAGISFSYDIQNVTLSTPANPTADDLEGLWRDPAMGALGFGADWSGVNAYVESLRTEFGTRWTYCGFFTKYPLVHFAYASIGGPRLVMDYRNDGWGPENIDRVFAHETGHIFNCPDEYASSGCDCGGSWGRFGIANGNCENCAAGGGVSCLMKANDFTMCEYTPSHLGWSPQLVVRDYGYVAGGWRVEKHPRLMADTTGDGRADIVGFGDAGAYVSRSQPSGQFEPPVLRVPDFGYVAGGWRVEKHPRLMADTTGDGRADIVGFGDAGVYTAQAQPDGSFGALQFVVANFGYVGGGWRVAKHPRLMADTTGDGRADIVGFGDAGVYVSRSTAGGTFTAPQLVVNDFGAVAGGWRVERHPRLVADITGDGRADIVGFGDAGVYVSLAQANGTYSAPELVVPDFGYVAGGWRVEKHPRFLADTTGDGRLDIVGFGEAGVYVARSLGGGKFEHPGLVVTNFGNTAGGWRVDRHPRFVIDTTGDGRADIVGFGDAGVWLSRS